MVPSKEEAGRYIMSHTFEISDQTYQSLMLLAAARGQEPEDLLEQWLDEVRTSTVAQPSSATPPNGTSSGYDPRADPLASFLGAFEATSPDVVRKHDAHVADEQGGARDPLCVYVHQRE